MDFHRRSSHWLLAMAVASLHGVAGMRITPAQAGEPTPSGGAKPAMVRFYGVDPSGVLAPENPLASGFALDSSASFEPVSGSNGTAAQSEEAADAGRTLQKNPAPLTIRLEYTNQRRRDSIRRQFDEFQCERHGFFYTAGGRCVLPARRHTTRIPRNHPDPRHRHMSRKRSPLPSIGLAR